MKKIPIVLRNLFVLAALSITSHFSFAQTSRDTIKTGYSNDPMVVNPGKVNDGMAVKPLKPNDGMSILSDTAFLAKNIMDNQMEIHLAKLGQDRSTDATVKKVASLMIADHQAILQDLQKLATSKQVAVHNHREMATGSNNFPDGKDFEATWAGQMLQMHEAKIVELESFLSLTKNEALRAVVLRAIPKLKTHREILEKIPGAKEKSKTTHTI